MSNFTFTFFGKKTNVSFLTFLSIILLMLVAFISSVIGLYQLADLYTNHGVLVLIGFSIMIGELTLNGIQYSVLPQHIIKEILTQVAFIIGCVYFWYNLFV
jgi:hypothetical protein